MVFRERRQESLQEEQVTLREAIKGKQKKLACTGANVECGPD
jgi:hypothetical protein